MPQEIISQISLFWKLIDPKWKWFCIRSREILFFPHGAKPSKKIRDILQLCCVSARRVTMWGARFGFELQGAFDQKLLIGKFDVLTCLKIYWQSKTSDLGKLSMIVKYIWPNFREWLPTVERGNFIYKPLAPNFLGPGSGFILLYVPIWPLAASHTGEDPRIRWGKWFTGSSRLQAGCMIASNKLGLDFLHQV